MAQSDEFDILLGFFFVSVVELLSFLEQLKSKCEKGDWRKSDGVKKRGRNGNREKVGKLIH